MPEVGEEAWIRRGEHRPINEYSDVSRTEVLATVAGRQTRLVAG